MQATGLEPIGTWSVIDSLNLTRMAEIQLTTNPYNGVFHWLASNLTKERVTTTVNLTDLLWLVNLLDLLWLQLISISSQGPQ